MDLLESEVCFPSSSQDHGIPSEGVNGVGLKNITRLHHQLELDQLLRITTKEGRVKHKNNDEYGVRSAQTIKRERERERGGGGRGRERERTQRGERSVRVDCAPFDEVLCVVVEVIIQSVARVVEAKCVGIIPVDD